MAPCSCVGVSRLEIREAIDLGVAGVQEMSMAFGFGCASCHGLAPPVDEAPRRPKSASPVMPYAHLPALYLRRS